MPDYSKDPDYGYTRLSGSLVMIDGVPRVVSSVGPERITWNHVNGKSGGSASHSSVTNNHLPLGFSNMRLGLGYLVRVPARQYKQGLRSGTIFDIRHGNTIQFNTRGLINTMMGIYPSLRECIEAIETGEALEGMAFSRLYALGQKEVGSSYTLLHRADVVGSCYLSGHNVARFELHDDKQYLYEEASEVFSNAKV